MIRCNVQIPKMQSNLTNSLALNIQGTILSGGNYNHFSYHSLAQVFMEIMEGMRLQTIRYVVSEVEFGFYFFIYILKEGKKKL
jgi:hypothetical protein